MYELRYDFGQYNEIISVYFEELVNQSTIKFQQQIKNKEVSNADADSLAGFIENIEEYLYYNFKKYPNKFNSIFNSIINDVKVIAISPEKGIYGRTEEKNKTIYINSNLTNSKNLTSEERTRLYVAHELGHVVNGGWMNRVLGYLNEQIRLKRITQKDAQLIYDGFSMLDEATTQNNAENFAYDFSNKKRPQSTYYRNGRLFGGQPYLSNYDFYGELQDPTVMFARTLRGIGKENDDLIALNKLSVRALSSDFFDKIINEYFKDNQQNTFIQLFQYMRLLKRASYANFGYEDISYLNNSSVYLNNFKHIAAQMRDYREPFNEEFIR